MFKSRSPIKNLLALIFISIFTLSFSNPSIACRMYGAISDNLQGGILQDHLVNLPNSIKNLGDSSNPDGWSVGYYPDGNPVPTVNRGYPQAYADSNFNLAVTEAVNATPRIVVSHVRNTSSGTTPASGDPHPFEREKNGSYWLMAHNGTIDKDVLLDLIRPAYLAANPPQYGSVQSEWIDSDLYQIFMLQTLGDFNWQVKPAIGYVINRLREEIGAGTSPSTEQLNFILTDGTTLWAYREGNTTHTLYYLDETDAVTDPHAVVASQYPSASQGSWVVISDGQLITLYQDSAPMVENIENYFGGTLLADSFFDDSTDSPDLRANSAGQDWYESRADNPDLLTLQSGYIVDGTGNDTNASAKAALLNYGSSTNAYLTQEFTSAQSDIFTVSFDIFINRIEDNGSYDRSALIYIGDDTTSSTNPPTGTSNERSVFMTFYDSSPGDTGDDLEIRARTLSSQAYGITSQWTSVATGLSYDTWYTIKLVLNVAGGTYDVYVNDALVGNIPKYSGYTASSVTHISFVADSDGRGDFYVDNVREPFVLPEPGDITIDVDFDSGSIGSYNIDGNEIDLTLRTEEFVNPSANPYYTYWSNFKVSGVQNQEITFNITNADDVPFLSDTNPAHGPAQIVYSCDGENWNRLTDYSYADGIYSFTETFTCNEVQIATFFPFSYQRMHDYVDAVNGNSWANETVLGQSAQGRDIDLITITNTGIPAAEKEDIYIIGRQHSGETASSHMLEGMIDFLISDDPDAEAMRDNFVWYIVPMVNPDGVYEGYSRATSLLRDPNRDWHSDRTESIEINIVRQNIQSINDDNGIEMFIDWHSQMSDVRWENFVYSPPGNTFFDVLSIWTDIDAQEAVGTSCGSDACTARGYATLELGLLMFGFEPTPHLETWTEETLYQEGINVAHAIADYYGLSEEPLITDSEFDDSDDSSDLRANTGGRDWYESRGDATAMLTLETGDVGGRTGNKAALKYSAVGSGYAYLTQEFPSPQNDTFCASFDMYIDTIFDDGDRDRSGMIYIGDNSGGTSGPNSTSNERFVFLAFYDPDLSNGDDVDDLQIRARELSDSNIQSWNTTGDWTLVTDGLSYDEWYNIRVDVNFAGGTYDVYVNDVLEGDDINKYDGYLSSTVTHISFSTGTAAQGDFYVDAVGECQEIVPPLLVDADFNESTDSADLRTNASEQDWYESRGDDPSLLFLDETNVGDNNTKKARFTASTSGNAYVSQEFGASQNGIFSVQWDIYLDNILDSENRDRSGFMMIGDDANGADGPNSTSNERFVFMAFYCSGGCETGTAELIAREPGDDYANSTEWRTIATGLPIDQWHTIQVVCDLDQDIYDVYVDGAMADSGVQAYAPKTSVTYISFAQWNDGAGTFYVDNVNGTTEGEMYSLEVNVAGTGGGTIETIPEKSLYNTGETVQLTAIENSTSAFTGWSGDIPSGQEDENPIELTMDSNKNVTAEFSLIPSELLLDTDLEANTGDDDLRNTNAPGEFWYESRSDDPALLTLDENSVGGNTTKKALLTGNTSNNAYLSQAFTSPQDDIFSVQWDIYVDAVGSSSYSRGAFMFIGDDADGQRGPNSTGGDRFVYMAFYKPGGGSDGVMDLVTRDSSGWSSSLIELNLDQWYTIKVEVDVNNNRYDVYVNGTLVGDDIIAYTSKTTLTHISFATWNDGPASFYVDNAMEAVDISDLRVSPTYLDFGYSLSTRTFQIENVGDESFDWTGFADVPWIVGIDPMQSSAALNPGESTTVTVTIDRNLFGEALPDTNCRMWGAISNTQVPGTVITSGLISDPNSLKNLTSSTENNDGWGVSYYTSLGSEPVITRGPHYASNPDAANGYDAAITSMAGANPQIALAHVRNCTSGCCENGLQTVDDPHPFYREKNGKTWLFHHNGSIDKTTLRTLIGTEYLDANPPNSSGIPECDPTNPDLVVDSELYFLLLLKNIRDNNWSVEQGIMETVAESVIQSSTSNFIMSDGYTVWAYRRGHDLAYYYDQATGYSAVASVPPNDGDNWTIMENNELLILRPGEAPTIIDFDEYPGLYKGGIHIVNSSDGTSASILVSAELLPPLPPEPTFVSLVPEGHTSSVGVPVDFTLTVGDGDGYDDISDVRFVIKEGTGLGTSSDAIVLWYTDLKPDRIYMWDHSESRWYWAVFGSSEILENTNCSLDASLSSIAGDGQILTFNFNIIPRSAFIEAPLGSNKRIWLQLTDTTGNRLREEIATWNVVP